MAPVFLRRAAERELAAFHSGSSDSLRYVEICSGIHYLSTLLCQWDSGEVVNAAVNAKRNQDKHNPLYVIHCRVHLPLALDPSGEAVDLKTFGREIERLRTEELPRLVEEKAAMEKELAAVKQHIEAPLDHWMQTGELSS